ncbi:MAG: hypothetical protein DRR06_09225 [Gammaproteobacteria bacterium]|nr:MAG: hypothetical protein DRR06_09225 [Gammaproteobacteria bacterium]
MLKKGQKVYSVDFGWGIVVSTTSIGSYPVHVEFNNNLYGTIETYTKKGERYSERNQSLFFEEIVIPESALRPPKEKWIPKEGESIVVRKDNQWIIKIFGGMVGERYRCKSGYIATTIRKISSFDRPEALHLDDKESDLLTKQKLALMHSIEHWERIAMGSKSFESAARDELVYLKKIYDRL